jgi:hypothetical protein
MIMLLCESMTNTQPAALDKSALPSTTAPAPKTGRLSTPSGLALQLHPHGHLSERLLQAPRAASASCISVLGYRINEPRYKRGNYQDHDKNDWPNHENSFHPMIEILII